VPCQTGWNTVDAPNPSPDVNFINAIDGVSANDIWAVGAFALSNGGTYALHWDGTAWTPILIPDVPEVTVLRGVKVIAANDVWAVGNTDDNTRGEQSLGGLLPAKHKPDQPADPSIYSYDTIIMHWDGTSWTRVPSPNPGTVGVGNELFSVDGVATNDLWAVGDYENSSGEQTLILHWNGSAWSQVASPAGGLSGVAAISSNNAWAVGSITAGNALILHWNGTQWSQVTSPNPGNESYLLAISALSANDIWAVGSYLNNSARNQGLTMHWDGTQWSVVEAPGHEELQGVSAVSSNDVWAVGINTDSGQAPIMHWDGSTWTLVDHPIPGPNPDDFSELHAVLATSSNEVWAVGDVGYVNLQTRIE
jgi:hypothetical protein